MIFTTNDTDDMGYTYIIIYYQSIIKITTNNVCQSTKKEMF